MKYFVAIAYAMFFIYLIFSYHKSCRHFHDKYGEDIQKDIVVRITDLAMGILYTILIWILFS